MKKLIVLLFVLFTTLIINAQAPNKCQVDTTTTYTYQIDQSVYKVYKWSFLHLEDF